MTRKINKLVVHCTASPDHMDIGAAEITQWHVNDRGWSTIGYHWVIRRDGTIEPGRDEAVSGAHVRGHNKDSIGIVWVGTNDIEDKQYDALITKVKECMYRHNIKASQVYGHYELYSGKTCPNLRMTEFRERLIKSETKVNSTEYLPDGPTEEEINDLFDDIEKDIL